jgi:small multidrug resistance pump
MISAYLSLLAAIVFEVAGTLMLPTTKEFSESLPTIIMSIFYIASFYFLTLALRAIPLAIVYACWSGLGVLAIAILSYFIYDQALNWQVTLGLFLIVNGVILVNIYTTNTY